VDIAALCPGPRKSMILAKEGGGKSKVWLTDRLSKSGSFFSAMDRFLSILAAQGSAKARSQAEEQRGHRLAFGGNQKRLSLAEIAENAEKRGRKTPTGRCYGLLLVLEHKLGCCKGVFSNRKNMKGVALVSRSGLCLGCRPALLRRLLRRSPAPVSA